MPFISQFSIKRCGLKLIFSKGIIENSKIKLYNKNEISAIITKLSERRHRLDKTYKKIKRYNQDIFDKCVFSVMNNRSADALVYANECARVRKLSNIILKNQLNLEYLSFKLETLTKYRIH
jgi:division protein CdvB (Snf7/Vps24/ESCRT-III family)